MPDTAVETKIASLGVRSCRKAMLGTEYAPTGYWLPASFPISSPSLCRVHQRSADAWILQLWLSFPPKVRQALHGIAEESKPRS